MLSTLILPYNGCILLLVFGIFFRPVQAVTWVVFSHKYPHAVSHIQLFVTFEIQIRNEDLESRPLGSFQVYSILLRIIPKLIQLFSQAAYACLFAEIVSEFIYICIYYVIRVLEPGKSHISYLHLRGAYLPPPIYKKDTRF